MTRAINSPDKPLASLPPSGDSIRQNLDLKIMPNPNFRVLSGTKDLTALWKDRLVFIKIRTESTHQMDQAEVEFDDSDPALSQPAGGAAFKLFIGYDEALMARAQSSSVHEHQRTRD
jgi:phage protein D